MTSKARKEDPVRTTEAPAGEMRTTEAPAKSVWLCVVAGCTERKAGSDMICSGHAVNYHDDGRRR